MEIFARPEFALQIKSNYQLFDLSHNKNTQTLSIKVITTKIIIVLVPKLPTHR